MFKKLFTPFGMMPFICRSINKFIYIQCYVLSHSFALYMCGCFSKTLDTKLQKWSIYRKYADKTANARLNNTFY